MVYLRRRNRIGDLSPKQRNPFFKALSLIVLGVSVSLFLVNADLIINPQISNSIAYIKQFFVTSDGTSSGTVGVILDNSGVFSKSFCNLSGSLCKTTEDLFAVDAQLSGLVPRDDGQYTLFASGGKLFTWGLKTTVNWYSLPTKLAIWYSSPTNALDVLWSAYISGSAEIIGSLTVPLLSGIASINGVNIWEFATWNTLVTNGFLTGGQVDTKLMTASNILMAYITGTYLPLTGCSTDQIPKFSGSLAKWVCSPDQVGVTSLTNYYTKGESDTNLATATGVLTTALNNYVALSQTGNWNTVYNWYNSNPLSSYVALSQTGNWNTVYNWYNSNPLLSYATTASLNNYVALSQTGNWNTVYNWYNSNPLSSYATTASLDNYVALSQTGNWNTVYNWYSGNPLSSYATTASLSSYATTASLNNYVALSQTGNWNTAYTNMHGHTNGSTLALISWQAFTNWNTVYNWYNSNPLSSYATTASLSSYATTASLSSYATTASLSSYATTASLSDYVTNSSLSTTLSSYATTASLNNYVALSQTGNWNTVYNWYAGNPLSSYVALSQTGNWNSAYTFVNNAATNNRLVIDTTNNRVGIWTNAPGHLLEVNWTWLFANSVYASAFLYNSDRRLKTNIVEIADPLTKITQLNGYTFDWKDTGRHDIWVIAQEVEEFFPEAVVTKENGFKTVNYPSLVAPLIAAVKELYHHYLDQQSEIDILKSEIHQLKLDISTIK